MIEEMNERVASSSASLKNMISIDAINKKMESRLCLMVDG
jgi:hypothetical protein